MVKSSENGSGFGSVPPFLKKCYEMVDDESTDSIISWGKSNDSFVIWDMTQFSVSLLSLYFKHNNFSSFIRQLNIYGFRKIDTDRWEFANDGFIRGQKHLLKNITRRKHPQVVDQQKALQQQERDNCDEPSQENSNHGLREEVENLKTDKNTLMQELIKLRQHQESAENKLLLLRDRLQGMEKNQQQMLSFLVMVMQSPGFVVQLIQPKENNWCMAEAGNMLELDTQDDNPAATDAMIVKYRPLIGEKLKPVATPSCADKEPEADHSADGLKDFFISTDFLKVLMDEKMCQLENNSPFILPDSPDDGAWQQLLLGSPFLGNIEDSNQESEGPTNSDMEFDAITSPFLGNIEDSNQESEGPTNSEMEFDAITSENPNEEYQTFESLVAEMELNRKRGLELCANGVQAEKLRSMESLTEQMELLASETDRTKGGKWKI